MLQVSIICCGVLEWCNTVQAADARLHRSAGPYSGATQCRRLMQGWWCNTVQAADAKLHRSAGPYSGATQCRRLMQGCTDLPALTVVQHSAFG